MPAVNPTAPRDTADPNDAQRRASAPTASAWVNASAGTGKTKVLTSRVVRLLLSGVKPEKILCLTYTRAAAAEMANRVMGVLGTWAICDEPALRKDIEDLQAAPAFGAQMALAPRLFMQVLACPGGLRMQTIHSFCQEILSRFPIEAGLSPQFAVIEPMELDVLCHAILDDLLRRAEAEPCGALGKALALLIAAQGESRFGDMLKEIVKARGKIERAAETAGSLAELKKEVRRALGTGDKETADGLRAEAMRAIPEMDVRKVALWLCEGSPRYASRGKALAEFLALPDEERPARFDDYLYLFLTKEQALFSEGYVASAALRKAHPDIDLLTEREGTRLLGFLARLGALETAEITEAALDFALLFAGELAARKAERGVLDYDDLIWTTEKLLRREGLCSWVLYKLDNGIDHILIDEAQDTSDPQWAIVNALSEEFFSGQTAKDGVDRTVFIVGDEKQSIFSFQGANPAAFLSQQAAYARRLKDADKKLESVPMHTSFRSAPAVLKAVDAVFALPEARQGVSIETVRHAAARTKDEKYGRVEVWPAFTQETSRTREICDWVLPLGYEEERDPEFELAERIADTILHWWKQKIVLPGYDRPFRPGDVMILLRRRGSFAALMVRLLKARSIPVTGVDRMRLVQQLPVMDLLAMVRFVLLPEDDLNLAALLRSPLMGLGDEDLMALAIRREGTLWQSLRRSGNYQQIDDYLSLKLKSADQTTPFDFLSQILNAPCPANATSGRKALWARLGFECLDPIDELLNAAQDFGRSHAPSLQNFLHWVMAADAEIKRELDKGDPAGDGQVRIMTVHAAKGLEAPIVFLPDGAGLPRAQELPRLQWSEDGLPFFLSAHDFGFPKALREKAVAKQLEEYRRLLYVAMTRAVNRLYICGWAKGKPEDIKEPSWYALAQKALAGLHQDYWETEGSGVKAAIVFADPCPSAVPLTATEKTASCAPPLPPWALRPAEAAEGLSASSTAYDASSTPDSAYARGRIIHRLLQSLPDIAPAKRPGAARRFLAQARHALTAEAQEEIAHEVGKLLSDERFIALFGPDSLAEAPLVGRLGGAPAFRQVDRLCLAGEEVWVVDYKTNRPPPSEAKDIPAAYNKQLGDYRALLSAVYPGKKVRGFLLWTYGPTLMEV